MVFYSPIAIFYNFEVRSTKVRKMSLRAIKYENKTLEILDQLLLPAQSKYIQIKGVEDGWKVINKMQVRLAITSLFMLEKCWIVG